MKAVLFIFIAAFLNLTQAGLQCKDENGNPVDWYVLYKLPREKKSDNPLIKNGVAYMYITSQNVSQGWTLSALSINSSASFPGHTLESMYNNDSKMKLIWVQYNDQPPNGPMTAVLGHTKGVVLSQTDGGFWLVHSVPHFPPPADTANQYSYPETGTHYGQSFLCISLNASQIDLVGAQLIYNEPKIFASNIPEDLIQAFPNLVAAAQNERVKTPPWYREQEIISISGQMFYSFAKAGKFSKELYFDWVAPTLQTNLLVESWRNGEGQLSSSCNSTFMVENISSLNVKRANLQFKTTRDHSKWAVADKDLNSAKDWVCVGDINRMENQEMRGGGTICINHYKLWPAYRETIKSIEPCPALQ